MEKNSKLTLKQIQNILFYFAIDSNDDFVTFKMYDNFFIYFYDGNGKDIFKCDPYKDIFEELGLWFPSFNRMRNYEKIHTIKNM